MSSRQIRRIQEKLQAEKLQAAKCDNNDDAGSGDDFEPLYMNSNKTSYDLLSSKVSAKNEKAEEDSTLNETNDRFSLLMIDAASPDVATDDDDVKTDDPPGPGSSQKKKRNNRKRKNKCRENHAATSVIQNEVERALAEVNSLLGEPSKPATTPDNDPAACARRALTQIHHKFLNPQEELTRRFGPDEEERRNQRPNIMRHLKRQIVLPNDSYNFFIHGITMKQVDSYKDQKYFKFVHSPKYQLRARNIIKAVKYHLATRGGPPDYDIFNNSTLEALLQNIDLYFMLEESTVACTALEGSIHFLQSIFCPAFSYFDGKSFLEYEIVENRPFHILLLKYLHLLTNKACHRTALEIAKLLLNIDPSDPLAVIFIVDTIALRAREHRWLVDIYKHWTVERDVGKLFHMLYSHALAKYHLYLKSKTQEDLEDAERHLKDALILYPNVAVMLFDHCKLKCPEVSEHELYSTMAKNSTSEDLRQLQQLYIAFAGPKWREGTIINWLKTNALRLCHQFDTDSKIKFECNAAMQARHLLFKENPTEIKRHLFVIRSMSNLLVEGAVPSMKATYSANPYPEKGRSTDINGYYGEPTREPVPPRGWRSFLDSMVPDPTYVQIYDDDDDID